MPININFAIIIFVSGAVLLAAVYHTILYLHRRTLLLARYSLYLWVTFVYTLFRCFYPISDPVNPFLRFINADETVQMIAFALYIRFMDIALDVNRQTEKKSWAFVKKTPVIIAIYTVVQLVIAHTDAPPFIVYVIAKFTIRGYLLFVGLFLLLSVILKRKKTYYYYLAGGAIAIIIFGIISAVANAVQVSYQSGIGSVSWLMMGFFLDVVFFSSAIGYRIKIEALEKEVALNALIKQTEILQQKEIEKVQAIYTTKEKERLRIANDLHDDIGASLSSLQIYSAIAEQAVASNPPKTIEMLQRIAAQSKQLLENMGDIVWSMKSASDNNTTLETKIKNFGAELLSDKNIDFTYNIATGTEVVLNGIAVRKNVLLLIKEAMHNTAKYSGAASAKLLMFITETDLVLEISDNGAGFDGTKSFAGNGLKNMAYRVKELKGTITIDTAPGKGTAIKVQIPLVTINDVE
jgi:signal transduction histidine kinase